MTTSSVLQKFSIGGKIGRPIYKNELKLTINNDFS